MVEKRLRKKRSTKNQVVAQEKSFLDSTIEGFKEIYSKYKLVFFVIILVYLFILMSKASSSVAVSILFIALMIVFFFINLNYRKLIVELGEIKKKLK